MESMIKNLTKLGERDPRTKASCQDCITNLREAIFEQNIVLLHHVEHGDQPSPAGLEENAHRVAMEAAEDMVTRFKTAMLHGWQLPSRIRDTPSAGTSPRAGAGRKKARAESGPGIAAGPGLTAGSGPARAQNLQLLPQPPHTSVDRQVSQWQPGPRRWGIPPTGSAVVTTGSRDTYQAGIPHRGCSPSGRSGKGR